MKNKEIGKLETITILLFSISIFIYEICFCNLKSIIQDNTYNFSLYRIVMYAVFVVLYIKFSKGFIEEAKKTIQAKKKIIIPYLVISIIFIIYKIITERNFYVVTLLMLSIINGLIFILYITKDYIKNIVVTILTLGFMFSISTEIYNVFDEKKHFVSTLNVAVGNFNLKCGLKNECFDNIEFETLSANFAMNYFDKKASFEMKSISEDEDLYSTPEAVMPLLYLPGSIGINIARLLGGSVADIFFAGRMTNLITFGILLIIIFKILPFKKDTFYAIFMLPMNLVLASYYSLDALIIGIIGIFISYIFRILKEKYDKIDFKIFLIIIGLYLLTLICKRGAYLAIGLILFVLPVFKILKENVKIRNITILIIISTIALGVFKAYNITDMGDERFEKSNPTKQIEYLLENPSNILKVYSNTLRITLLNF